MLKGLLAVSFLLVAVVVTAQTPRFSLDSVPKSALWKHTPYLFSLDSIKKLPSESLSTFGGENDLVFGQEMGTTETTVASLDGMVINPAVSKDNMKIVVPDTTKRQYLRVYGKQKD